MREDETLCPKWDKQIHISNHQAGKAKVLIPVFPWEPTVNTIQRKLSIAPGGKVAFLVVRNQTPADLKESIVEMTKALKESHILMLPGGFSAGDEPEGAGEIPSPLCSVIHS